MKRTEWDESENNKDYKENTEYLNTAQRQGEGKESLLWNVEELAAYLNVKTSKVRMMVFRKEVPYLKIGALVRFHRHAIDAWLLHLSHASPAVVRKAQLFDSSILSNGSPQKRRSE